MPGAQVYVNGARVRPWGLGEKSPEEVVELDVERALHHHQRLNLQQDEVEEALKCTLKETLGDGEAVTSSTTADIQDSPPGLGNAESGPALSADCRVVFGRQHLFRFDIDSSRQGTAQTHSVARFQHTFQHDSRRRRRVRKQGQGH